MVIQWETFTRDQASDEARLEWDRALGWLSDYGIDGFECGLGKWPGDRWARLDTERYAFSVESGGDSKRVIITVTTDHDGAPDGHSKVTQVEIRRASKGEVP